MKKIFFVLTFFLPVALALSSEQLLIHVLRKEFLEVEDELWGFLSSQQHTRNDVDPWINVVREFYNYDQKIKQMPQEILHGLQVVQDTKQFAFLYSDLRVIDDLYEKFRRYQITTLKPNKKIDNKRQITTSDMVDDILYDEKNNVNATLQRIFNALFGSNTDNIIWEIFEIVSPKAYICEHDQTPQQVFYNLYNVIALTELKGFVMMQFAYLSDNFEGTGRSVQSSLAAREEYKDRANNTMATFRGSQEIMSGKVWKCDPKSQISGKTFVEVTRLLQGHIQNEADLNGARSCRETCGVYRNTQSYGCYDSDSDYCQRRKPCNGKILNCRFIESHLKACIPHLNNLRRYEYVEYKSGKVMGDKRRCQNKDVNSWFRWFVHCSYCMCLCDEQGPLSDRYFNTREVMADVANNRVVTGLRIIKHNRIIHLQIQEGKLLPYGYIDNRTVRWVPVDNFKITDPGVKSGLDYHTMTYEQRNMQLDDLTSHQSNHIVTGVGFQFIDGFLRIQINVRPFDFKTGLLGTDSHYIYGTGVRSKINLDNSDIPTKSNRSEPEWGTNLYVKFTHTDFDKDVAQTTIPFIDSQPVTNVPQVPLRGVGIYYKGSAGYGGFIAPSMTTYDFSKHMNMEFPNPKDRPLLVEYTEVDVN